MSEEKKRVAKRLPAPITIGLRKLQREHEKQNEEYSEWAKDRADELGLYFDQVNLETGAVLDPILGDRIIKRLPLEGRTKEIQAEARSKIRDMNKAGRALNHRLQEVSLDYGLPAKSLNLSTGEISEDVTFETARTVEEQEQDQKAEEKVLKPTLVPLGEEDVKE